MALKVVTPVTKRGAAGLRSIMDETAVATWSSTHAAELLDAGYVRLIVTDHVPSRIVGDWRVKRCRTLA